MAADTEKNPSLLLQFQMSACLITARLNPKYDSGDHLLPAQRDMKSWECSRLDPVSVNTMSRATKS